MSGIRGEEEGLFLRRCFLRRSFAYTWLENPGKVQDDSANLRESHDMRVPQMDVNQTETRRVARLRGSSET